MVRFALQNAVLTLIADVATRLSGTILMILVARQLGEAEAGRYVLGNGYVFLLLPVALWGLDQIFIRDVAGDQDAAMHQFANYLVLRLVISGALWAGLALLMALGRPYEAETNRFIAALGGLLVSEGVVNLAQTYLVLVNRSLASAGVAVAAGSVRVLAAYHLLANLGHSRLIPSLLVGVGWLQAAALLLYVGRHLPVKLSHLDSSFCRAALFSAFPLVPIGLMISLEAQIGTLILSFFRGEADVGIYGMATTVVSAAGLLAQSVRTGVYPVLAQVHRSSRERFALVYERLWRYLAILALPLMMLLFVLAGVIVRRIFDVDAPAAVTALQALSLLPVFSFLNIPSARVMVLEDQQTTMMRFFFVSTGLNVVFSVVGAAALGVLGVALARVISMAILFAMLVSFVRKHVVPAAGWRRMGRLGLAGIAATVIVIVVHNTISPLWGALLTVLGYALAVTIFGAVTPLEVQWLRNEFGRFGSGGS